jgi:hypothetical protein
VGLNRAVGVQQAISSVLGYELKTAGALDISNRLAFIGEGVEALRGISEERFGLGATAVGFGVVDAGAQIGTLLLGARPLLSAAKRGSGSEVAANSADMFRKIENTGEFSGLKVPMQSRYVDIAAQEGGIGLDGVKVRIVRDPELIGKDLYGYTHPDGSIDLYPDAFTNTEQLVKTLGHERTHTMQIDIFGHPNKYSADPIRLNQELRMNENAAHGIEDSFWQYYLSNKTGRLGKFE